MTKEQKILLLFVLAIAASSATFYVVKQKSSANNETGRAVTTTNPTSASMESTNPGTVKPAETGTITTGGTASENKTYTENVHFSVPNGFTDDITVTAVVDALGNIVDVKFTYDTPTNPVSGELLGNFKGAFSASTLVGKKINDAQISRTGGASLTTKAFNQALKTISTKVTS